VDTNRALGPIASMFWLDDALESSVFLDGIVTLVDAKYIGKVRIGPDCVIVRQC
jgi:hypothetical protein